jgi:hypothetical protein
MTSIIALLLIVSILVDLYRIYLYVDKNKDVPLLEIKKELREFEEGMHKLGLHDVDTYLETYDINALKRNNKKLKRALKKHDL